MDESDLETGSKNRTRPKVTRTVPKERIAYLWKRVRNAARAIGRLSKMSKDIELLGSSTKVYTEKTPKQQVNSSHSSSSKPVRFLIYPRSNFLKYWSIIMLLILLYTLTITPFLVCFMDEVDSPLSYLNLTIDLLFCSDIAVNFFLVYENDEGILVLNRNEIIKHYLKTWFFIDFVSSIPFQYIEQTFMKNNYNKLFRLLRLPRLYKLVKVLKVSRLTRIFKRYEFVKKIMNVLREHTGIVNLIKFSVTVTILVHVMGCLWFFTAKFNDFIPDTWVFRHGYINSDLTTLYITSIYFVFTTLTTVGYGDIVAYTTEERVFALLIMSFGVAFYSYTISNLSTIMASIDSRTLNMKARISALNEFSKATKLPEDLKQRIKSHILLNYEENIFSWFDQDSLMNELPNSLRTEVSLHMHHKIVEKIYFFQDKDPGFISYMVPKLRTICLQAGDYLYKEHEYPDEVYFLTRGKVNLKTQNGIAFKTYVQGSYFGEVEILENKTRSCSVQAHKEGAEFLVLSKRQFLKTMEEFPKIAEEIRETARMRGIKNSEAKDSVLQIGQSTRVSNTTKSKFNQDKTTLSSTCLVDENSSYKLERMKSRTVNSTREKHRKMWQQLIQEKNQQGVKPAQPPIPKKSKWDLMLGLFRRKSNVIVPNRPVDLSLSKPELENEDSMSGGFLKKAITMHPAKNLNSKPGSKWNIVRGKYNKILQMSRENEINNSHENFEHKERFDWLLDDANVGSPLGTESDSKTDPKLLLLKTLNSHLAEHNWRMQCKINVARKAFGLLKVRQEFIKSQIDNMYQSAIEKYR